MIYYHLHCIGKLFIINSHGNLNPQICRYILYICNIVCFLFSEQTWKRPSIYSFWSFQGTSFLCFIKSNVTLFSDSLIFASVFIDSSHLMLCLLCYFQLLLAECLNSLSRNCYINKHLSYIFQNTMLEFLSICSK